MEERVLSDEELPSQDKGHSSEKATWSRLGFQQVFDQESVYLQQFDKEYAQLLRMRLKHPQSNQYTLLVSHIGRHSARSYLPRKMRKKRLVQKVSYSNNSDTPAYSVHPDKHGDGLWTHYLAGKTSLLINYNTMGQESNYIHGKEGAVALAEAKSSYCVIATGKGEVYLVLASNSEYRQVFATIRYKVTVKIGQASNFLLN